MDKPSSPSSSYFLFNSKIYLSGTSQSNIRTTKKPANYQQENTNKSKNNKNVVNSRKHNHVVKQCSTKFDLGFALDATGSMREAYSKEKDFVKQMAAHFGIGQNKV